MKTLTMIAVALLQVSTTAAAAIPATAKMEDIYSALTRFTDYYQGRTLEPNTKADWSAMHDAGIVYGNFLGMMAMKAYAKGDIGCAKDADELNVARSVMAFIDEHPSTRPHDARYALPAAILAQYPCLNP